MRVADIESINAAALTALRRGEAPPDHFRGYLDVTFLETPPFVMFTNGDCTVCNEILRTGAYEPGSLGQWVRRAGAATSIIDIGAYSGIYALAAAAARPGLAVYAFEPNPNNCARLRLNKAVNRLTNLMDSNFAVSKDAGLTEIKWMRKAIPGLASTSTIANLTLDPAQLETAVVKTAPLNDPTFLASLGERPLIKVDVEGSEAWAMAGLLEILPRKPDIILETFSPKACDQIAAHLAPHGYRAYLIDEATGELHPQPRLAPADPNGPNRNQLLTAV